MPSSLLPTTWLVQYQEWLKYSHHSFSPMWFGLIDISLFFHTVNFVLNPILGPGSWLSCGRISRMGRRLFHFRHQPVGYWDLHIMWDHHVHSVEKNASSSYHHAKSNRCSSCISTVKFGLTARYILDYLALMNPVTSVSPRKSIPTSYIEVARSSSSLEVGFKIISSPNSIIYFYWFYQMAPPGS